MNKPKREDYATAADFNFWMCAWQHDEIGRLLGLLREVYDGRQSLMPVGLAYRIGHTLNHSAADQPAAAPQAPIARVSVWACLPPSVTLYAPGLPPGEYDLYCEPEATAPMMRAADNAAAQSDAAPTVTPHDDPCLLVAGMSEDFIGGSISDQPDAAREIERANLVYERGAFVLMELMKAYERRVRSDCKSQADLDAKPWECAEYRAAADFLRKTWPTPAAADNSTGKPQTGD